MKRITKVLLIGVLLCSLSVVVFGEGQKESGEKKIELEWLFHLHANQPEWGEQAIEKYQEMNPNVTVKPINVQGREVSTKARLTMASGTAPDLLTVFTPADGSFLALSDYVAPAPERIANDVRENFIPAVENAVTIEGKIYGYTQEVQTLLPFVNVDIYQEAGIEYPETLKDFLDVQEKMLVKEGGALKKAGVSMINNQWRWIGLHYSPFLWGYGGKILNDSKTKAAFNSAAGEEALIDYKKLAPIEITDVGEAFYKELTATWVSGVHSIKGIDSNAPDLNYKVIPAPTGKDGNKIALGYTWMTVVNKATENMEEAWNFAQYLNGEEQDWQRHNIVGVIPQNIANIEKALSENTRLSTFIDESKYARFYPRTEKWLEIEQAIGTGLQKVFVEEETIEEGLSNLEEEVNKILVK